MSNFRYPLYLFPSFTLGAEHRQMVHNENELFAAIRKAIDASPIGEALVSVSPEPFHDGGEGDSKVINATRKTSTE